MHHRDYVLAEPAGKALYNLAGQRYFRYQHDCGAPQSQTPCDGLHVHLSLAAGCHPMNEEVFLPAFINGPADFFNG